MALSRISHSKCCNHTTKNCVDNDDDDDEKKFTLKIKATTNFNSPIDVNTQTSQPQIKDNTTNNRHLEPRHGNHLQNYRGGESECEDDIYEDLDGTAATSIPVSCNPSYATLDQMQASNQHSN